MSEKKTLVIKRGRRATGPKQFAFTEKDISASAPRRDYALSAWKIFQELPLPSRREEAWRRTDLHKMPLDTFHLPEAEAWKDLPAPPAALLQPLTDASHGGQVVLSPGGGVRRHLDEALRAQGVIFTDFKQAEREHGALLARLLGQVVRADAGKFAALAAALAQNGVLLYVPRGVTVEQPLHSILWGPGAGLAHITHLIVWLEEGASATFVHEMASPDEPKAALHAGLVEVHLGDEAHLRFVELQSWGRHVWNFSHQRARVGRNASLDWIYGAVGSHLTKNFSDLDLVGYGASGRMSGFYFADGRQHFDLDTQQNHFAPRTSSDLLYKGALSEAGRTVWQGMIYVAPGAQKTDGYQSNRNLVLSNQARADSIPGLEILADDVRCTHGATVGKIDEEPYFYLLSRGIPPREAYRLIVEGFFTPIMDRIPFEGVRERFAQVIEDKLNK